MISLTDTISSGQPNTDDARVVGGVLGAFIGLTVIAVIILSVALGVSKLKTWKFLDLKYKVRAGYVLYRALVVFDAFHFLRLRDSIRCVIYNNCALMQFMYVLMQISPKRIWTLTISRCRPSPNFLHQLLRPETWMYWFRCRSR